MITIGIAALSAAPTSAAARQGDGRTGKALQRQSEREHKASEQRQNKDQPLNEIRIGVQPHADRFASLQSARGLSIGSSRFERVTSGLCRDTSILLAERIDGSDLALEGLETVQKVRPEDPKQLWTMGWLYRLARRIPEDPPIAEGRVQLDGA